MGSKKRAAEKNKKNKKKRQKKAAGTELLSKLREAVSKYGSSGTQLHAVLQTWHIEELRKVASSAEKIQVVG
jgi:hypothetical protein